MVIRKTRNICTRIAKVYNAPGYREFIVILKSASIKVIRTIKKKAFYSLLKG